MSIFKETFPDYVYNQLQIRKETLRSGDSASLGRFSKQRNAYSGSRGGGITQEVINLDERAFFTYTTEKQCVIKMSSGVDLTYWNINNSVLCDMDANDTAYVQIKSSNDTSWAVSGGANDTRFFGYLVA